MSIIINGKNFSEEEYERLLNLVNEGGKFSDIKRVGLESIYSAFRNLAVLYLDQYTNLDKKKFRYQSPGATKALIKHQIFSEEDIRTKIPVCPYCDTGKHVIPNSKNNGEFVGHCGNRKCMGMYKKDLIEEKVEEKYGVKNISSLDSMKKLKSKKLKDAYARKGEEINEKRRKTVQKKYGVDNISQLNEVKAKKGQTFTEHYGVDNIFKRNDLMKQYWKEKLGVTNPILDKETVLRQIEHFNVKKEIEVFGERVIVLEELEEEIANYLSEHIPYKYSGNISFNNEFFLLRDEEGDYGYIADIFVKPGLVIELKNFVNTKPKFNDKLRDGKFLRVIEQYKKKISLLFYLNHKEKQYILEYDRFNNSIVIYANLSSLDELKSDSIVLDLVRYCKMHLNDVKLKGKLLKINAQRFIRDAIMEEIKRGIPWDHDFDEIADFDPF